MYSVPTGNFFGQNKKRKEEGKPGAQFKSNLVPNTLFLSSSEVKLFSGHVLNFVRNTCPQVNSTQIYLFQKLISTRTTASIHKASDKRQAFNEVLKNLRACNSKSVFIRQPPQLIDRIWTKFSNGAFSTLEYFGLTNLTSNFQNCLFDGFDSLTNVISIKNVRNQTHLYLIDIMYFQIILFLILKYGFSSS